MTSSSKTTKTIPYLSVGDEVYYQHQYKAKVVKIDVPVKGDNNKLGALIEFDKKDLIPPHMEAPYRELTLCLPAGKAGISTSGTTDWGFGVGEDPWCQGKKPDINAEVNCPECGEEWKETWINYKPYYDCLKCNIKREDVWPKN